jgi:hypothetical protein
LLRRCVSRYFQHYTQGIQWHSSLEHHLLLPYHASYTKHWYCRCQQCIASVAWMKQPGTSRMATSNTRFFGGTWTHAGWIARPPRIPVSSSIVWRSFPRYSCRKH